VDVIASVMGGSKNFVGEKHTVAFLRAGELLISRLPERRSWQEWDESGKEGLVERAQAQAEQLLGSHEVPPLSDEQEQELDKIYSAAREQLVGRENAV
jgi:trimethylamine:corrinoid methyltransferase-like protein